jgi:DNA polymerase
MMKMDSLINRLSIDIETYSSADLAKCGVYKYSESVDFEILLFGYSIDGSDVHVVDLAGGEKIPSAIIGYLKDDRVIKCAFNAMFERVCLSRYLGLPPNTYLSPASWHCDMIWAAYLGLPLSLKGVGTVLKLEKQKLYEGKSLIGYFCKPCSPTKANGYRSRNYCYHDKEKWNQFLFYNKRDVVTELAIQKKLSKFPVPDSVWKEYTEDQKINDRGVRIDQTLVSRAIDLDTASKEELGKHMQILTQIENPNSVKQLKDWLNNKGIEVESLGKKDVAKLKEDIESGDIANVLTLRQQLSKSSVKKYQAMENVVCSDGRVHGMFQFYGANRSGRFSGRIVQLQNLPQNHLEDLESARNLVKDGNMEALKLLYEDVPDTLSQLIRTAFIPRENNKFIIADFSAIEARVIAWYAHESWRLKAFEKGEDIYCASASKMFRVPVVKHGINGKLRQKGKIAELALGYGGSVGALTAMGALDMGLRQEELGPLVKAWRKANPAIVDFWWDVDKAVKNSIKARLPQRTHGLVFGVQSGILFITLPSKRRLAYVKPKIIIDENGSEKITYEGVGEAKKWERIESYGPKFVENIVQGTARDILCNSINNLSEYDIVMHVHDEVIIDAPISLTCDEVISLMTKNPSWCEDLCLKADGYECSFYQKD